MAGSRLETIGSVFTRTRNLMRAGVLKEKPLWFDVYEAFPPLREPVFRRPRLRYGKAKADIQDIFYREDQIRAKFFSAYGSGQKAFDLFNPNFKSTCQRSMSDPKFRWKETSLRKMPRSSLHRSSRSQGWPYPLPETLLCTEHAHHLGHC
ncbi:28S ribosomal protein S23, mitochondrial isoform X2 [Cricetulus griseus]|uniref:Small ribosomal subunit protein mS23 n=2 Tax=Cricetulus griseus TaxID=10029 RepID=A0A9J7H4P2_CRIGR|nr:28S ribosomal protein S23, mitochondrial isoform X2 [Cricetulus griseus]ERE67284.1 28S ribosomal protein S23 [Cricetulus griseus]